MEGSGGSDTSYVIIDGLDVDFMINCIRIPIADPITALRDLCSLQDQ